MTTFISIYADESRHAYLFLEIHKSSKNQYVIWGKRQLNMSYGINDCYFLSSMYKNMSFLLIWEVAISARWYEVVVMRNEHGNMAAI